MLLAIFLPVLYSNLVFANTAELQIRGIEKENFSRIVFDWGKDVTYKEKRSDGVVDIIFKAKSANIDISKVNTSKLKGLLAIKHIKLPRNDTYIRLALAKGAKHRSYKLGNRIIFDLYHPALFKKQKNKIAHTKTHKAYRQKLAGLKAKPVKKPSIIKAEKEPVDKITKTHDMANKPQIEDYAIKSEHHVSKVEGENKIEKAPVTKIEQEEIPLGYTTIMVSTIEPVSLAVFERFGYLWLVIDNDFASIVPAVSGPFSAILGEPKKIKVKNGMAYKFKMPKQAEIASILYNNLAWTIALKPSADELAMNKAGQLRRIVRPRQKSEAEIFLPKADKILKLFDDEVGDYLYVITASASESRVSLGVRYPEFSVLKAYQGAVIKPFVDYIKLNKAGNNIIITAPKGLIMTRDLVELPVASNTGHSMKSSKANVTDRLFDFYGWIKGGRDFLWQNQREIEAKLKDVTTGEEAASVYLEMALLYFANGYGHEAIGALRAAAMENPELAKNPGFLAVKGGAEALAGFPLLAIRDLSTDSLVNHPEAKMWVGFAAAMSEQWKLAAENFPASNTIIMRYPPNIAIPFILYMAESALRVGDTVRARILLQTLKNMRKDMRAEQKAAEQYLLGEAYRQEGNYIKALKEWYPVVNGRDRLFHVKASIATVNLLRKLNKITDEEAQDRLETLRYLWRGDGLEIQMLHNIAKLYLEKNEYIRGLEEMRKAVVLAEEMMLDSSALVTDMEKIFSNLFVKGKADEMEPFRAVAIYDSFQELKPVGYDSYVAEQHYANYLLEMDLLDEAEKILEKQLTYDWPNKRKISEIGVKLASIYLLDGKAKDAISVLQRTNSDELDAVITEKRELLRARALSEIGMIEQAINTLNNIKSEEALRLKADIYWKNAKWGKAAETLVQILPTVEEINDNSDIADSELILNAAVAYKLSNNIEKLQELRKKYLTVMNNTRYGASFAVVTRKEEGNISISDRQEILNMASEVDLFKQFLKDYQAAKIY